MLFHSRATHVYVGGVYVVGMGLVVHMAQFHAASITCNTTNMSNPTSTLPLIGAAVAKTVFIILNVSFYDVKRMLKARPSLRIASLRVQTFLYVFHYGSLL